MARRYGDARKRSGESAVTCNDEGVCIKWSCAMDRAKRNVCSVSGSMYEVRQIWHEPMTMIEKGLQWNEAVITLSLGEHMLICFPVRQSGLSSGTMLGRDGRTQMVGTGKVRVSPPVLYIFSFIVFPR